MKRNVIAINFVNIRAVCTMDTLHDFKHLTKIESETNEFEFKSLPKMFRRQNNAKKLFRLKTKPKEQEQF